MIRFTDLGETSLAEHKYRIQIYLSQVQGMVLGIMYHLQDAYPDIKLKHLTTLTYSAFTDTMYVYFNNPTTGELVKDMILQLFNQTKVDYKNVLSDQVGDTYVIELYYGAEPIIKYNKKMKVKTQRIKNDAPYDK